MFSVIIFFIVLGVLVLVHELGHFLMAKRAGMRVEEFGFGFPPRLFGIKKGETIYSINWIPFGGFVKIFGENGEGKENQRSFVSKKAGTRAGVIVAGVVMNVILSFVLLSIGNVAGIRLGLTDQDVPSSARDLQVQIIQIAPASPAEQAGLQMLDVISGFKVAGQDLSVQKVSDVQQVINSHRGESIVIKIKRGDERLEKTVTPRLNPPPGEGALGISLALTGMVQYPWYEAIGQGAKQTAVLLANTVLGFGQVIKKAVLGEAPGAELSGPVGIAKFTGQAARIGWVYLLQLMALLSVNLAVLNVIPFPALDGGRLLFILIEKIKRSPLSKRVEATANAIGFSLLILLMIYVTTKDILRFF